MPAHHCRKSFLLWLQSVGYKQKHGGFAYERSSRLRSNEVPGGDFKRRNGLAQQDGGTKSRQVRVCTAKRSNESPSGAFKRRNGLAQQDGGTKSRQVPIWEKSNLTLEEAAAYSGIGINKLREMSDSKDCTFVLWNGTKRLLKRRRLDEHLDRLFSI